MQPIFFLIFNIFYEEIKKFMNFKIKHNFKVFHHKLPFHMRMTLFLFKAPHNVLQKKLRKKDCLLKKIPGQGRNRALARIWELGVQKYTFGVELGVQFLFIPLHYTQKIWILGCPKSAIGCPKDTRTPLWLKACVGSTILFSRAAFFCGIGGCFLHFQGLITWGGGGEEVSWNWPRTNCHGN